MSDRPTRQVLCHHCLIILPDDDHVHYGYICHDCVIDEHEGEHLARRDPDHPDLGRRPMSPVLIRVGPRIAQARVA